MGRAGGGARAETANRLQKVGFCPLPGFNADVWVRNGYAYVGSEGTGRSLGVAIVDVRKPAVPRLVGRVAGIPNTTAEDVMVVHVETPAFRGELLAAGIQARDYQTAAPHGIDLWDVTEPRRPKHLAFWEYAHAQSGPARGVHELYLFARGDHAYVAGMVPDAEEYEQMGDFRLLDVTDPFQRNVSALRLLIHRDVERQVFHLKANRHQMRLTGPIGRCQVGDAVAFEETPLHIVQHGGTIAPCAPECDRIGREPASREDNIMAEAATAERTATLPRTPPQIRVVCSTARASPSSSPRCIRVSKP